jgi:hypothetical protein
MKNQLRLVLDVAASIDNKIGGTTNLLPFWCNVWLLQFISFALYTAGLYVLMIVYYVQ